LTPKTYVCKFGIEDRSERANAYNNKEER